MHAEAASQHSKVMDRCVLSAPWPQSHALQLPTGPPSSLVMTISEERGRLPASPSGHEL
jgi:hypothetical protein